MKKSTLVLVGGFFIDDFKGSLFNNQDENLTTNWNHQWNRFAEMRFDSAWTGGIGSLHRPLGSGHRRRGSSGAATFHGGEDTTGPLWLATLGDVVGARRETSHKKSGSESLLKMGWFKKYETFLLSFDELIMTIYIYVICIWWMYSFYIDLMILLLVGGCELTHKERVFWGSDQTTDSWSQETITSRHCITICVDEWVKISYKSTLWHNFMYMITDIF